MSASVREQQEQVCQIVKSVFSTARPASNIHPKKCMDGTCTVYFSCLESDGKILDLADSLRASFECEDVLLSFAGPNPILSVTFRIKEEGRGASFSSLTQRRKRLASGDFDAEDTDQHSGTFAESSVPSTSASSSPAARSSFLCSCFKSLLYLFLLAFAVAWLTVQLDLTRFIEPMTRSNESSAP